MSVVDAATRLLIEERAAFRCEYCRLLVRGQIATFPVDHSLPRSRGGSTDLSNLALACPHCNGHKWAHTSALDPAAKPTIPDEVSTEEPFTHRGDSRSPAEIQADGGFKAKGTNMSVENHLHGNEPSGYIGTSKSVDVAIPMAGEGGYVYTVRLPNGIDVEIYWQAKYGEPYYGPYGNEAEVLAPLRILWENVMGWRLIGPGDQPGPLVPNPGFQP